MFLRWFFFSLKSAFSSLETSLPASQQLSWHGWGDQSSGRHHFISNSFAMVPSTDSHLLSGQILRVQASLKQKQVSGFSPQTSEPISQPLDVQGNHTGPHGPRYRGPTLSPPCNPKRCPLTSLRWGVDSSRVSAQLSWKKSSSQNALTNPTHNFLILCMSFRIRPPVFTHFLRELWYCSDWIQTSTMTSCHLHYTGKLEWWDAEERLKEKKNR